MGDFVVTNICRLCADVKEPVFQIFNDEGYKLALGIKINKYLQIQVDEKDSLPKNVCWDCLTKLEDCSNFVNNSQNAQITLSQKIFSVFNEESSLKGENVFPSETMFDHASTLLDFNTESVQVDKDNEPADTFECDDIDLGDSSSNCFYSDKQINCLFDERNRTDEHILNAPSENPTNSNLNSECDPRSLNLRKKPNKRKCITPVRYLTNNSLLHTRTKRKLCLKKKISESKKKKANTADEDDYCETESELFKEKYFNQIPWMCTSCVEKFETLKELQNHHVNHHLQTPRYMCPHCYKIYMQYHGFVTHLKKFQCSDVQCENCDKVFPNKKLLDLHRRMHVENPPFQCSSCDKSFKQQSGLYAHTRCHLPDHLKKEYACDQCDKCFSTKPNLLTHQKIHIGLKNNVCHLCGKSFVQKGNLSAHILTHSDNKPFTCEICQKEFKTAMQLRKHGIIHTGEKPHQCDICGRTFRERGTLKEHSRIHTGVMPFSCEFCGKAFRFKGVLTTHRRQHTGERPYSCSECQHHFTNWPNYNKHMKRRHGINKSRSNNIKSDSVAQNNSITEGNSNQTEAGRIEIPSFETALRNVSIDSDKSLRLFEEASADPFMMSSQSYNNPLISQQQNALLSAYYNIDGVSVINPDQQIDVMNSSIPRDFL